MSEERLTREHIDKYKNLLETFANLKSLVQEKKKLEKQNDDRLNLKIRTLNGKIKAEKMSLIDLLSDDDKDYFIMVFFWDEAKKERITGDFFQKLGRTDLILRTLTEFEKQYLFDIDILEKAYKEQGIKGDLLTNVKMTNAWNEKRKRRKLKELMLPNEGGRRTRGKLRAKSRAKSRKKRRRKGGGPRKNAFPEEPIVDYYYNINIYHGGQGEKVLQYGNVIGKYLGLAEGFNDGFDSIEGNKLMFRTPHITDEDGDELETIGEIISKIGPDIKYINGGRRKKRTKKRRKSKGRKRRKKRRKSRRKRKR